MADGTVITISKTGQSVDPNIIQFADENVKKLCVGMWDTNGDLELSYDEAATVTSLGTTFTGNSEIQIFNELKHFTGLTVLDDAFSGCSNLWKVTIPVNVESMTFNNFKGCSSLEMITFEKGSKLESISGVRDLGAFDGAINLTTVDMSECTQVKRIDEYTFYGNSNLRLFKIGTEIPPTCKDYTFYNINPYSVLKVPSGCTDAYKKATGWKKFASITGLDE